MLRLEMQHYYIGITCNIIATAAVNTVEQNDYHTSFAVLDENCTQYLVDKTKLSY